MCAIGRQCRSACEPLNRPFGGDSPKGERGGASDESKRKNRVTRRGFPRVGLSPAFPSH